MTSASELTTESSADRPLIEVDAELGRFLAPGRLEAARRDLQVHVTALGRGDWDPHQVWPAGPGGAGLLVLAGILARELRIRDTPSTELFGPGDIIRTWRSDSVSAVAPEREAWSCLQPGSLALLDRRGAMMLRHYPEVMAVVLDRLDARAERLAVTQAISHLLGVEHRVEALFWHLAERWGRMGPHGAILPVRLSHRLIGSLVGARRPTVTAAMARLEESNRVLRHTDGWLLPRPAPVPT